MSTPAQMALAVRRMAKDWGLGSVTLNEALDASETDVDIVDLPEALKESMYIECDLELMEVTALGSTLTVRRGQLGTTAATHLTNVVMIAQPRFTNTSIMEALNIALHMLNGLWPREVYLTNATLLTASDTERFALPAKPSGEGDYLDILGVEVETGTDGLYRPAYNWKQEGHGPPALKLFGSDPTGRDLRLHLTQEYEVMAYLDAARPTELMDKHEPFLTQWAAGILLEQDDIYAANFSKQDTAVASDFRGRQQVIGRNLQAGAEAYLSRVMPANRNVALGDARNYRR